MRGSVLGFDAVAREMVVRGDDARRYRFAGAQWREDDPPRKGDRVDFEADGGLARDVYRISSGGVRRAHAHLGSDAPLDLMAANPWVRYLLARPALPLSLLVLVFCLVGAYTIDGARLSLLAAPELAWRMSAGIDRLLETSGADPGPRLAGALGRIFTAFLLLLYAVPALAGLVAWREFVGRPDPRLTRLAGIAAIVLPLALPLLVVLVVRIGVVPALPDVSMRLGRAGVSSPLAGFDVLRLFAIAPFVLAATGFALWAAGSGRLAARLGPLLEATAPSPAASRAGRTRTGLAPNPSLPPRSVSRARDATVDTPVPPPAMEAARSPSTSPRASGEPRAPAVPPEQPAPRSSTMIPDALADLTEKLRLAMSGNPDPDVSQAPRDVAHAGDDPREATRAPAADARWVPSSADNPQPAPGEQQSPRFSGRDGTA